MHRRDALVCIALATLWTGRSHGAASGLWNDRRLRGPDGKATSLSDRAGGDRLVVVTMKGHWCPVCLAQLARLAKRQPRLERLRTRVVGLNADSWKANAEAARATGVALPILSDPEHRVLDALGLWRPKARAPMPALVVFDECGSERWRRVGRAPDERVEGALLSALEKIAAAPPRCREAPNA